MAAEQNQVIDDELPSQVRITLEGVASVALLKAAKRVPSELWHLSQEALEQRARPSKTAFDLRTAIWRAAGQRGKIKLRDLASAAQCSYTHAYQLLTARPEILAWLLAPAIDLRIDLEVAKRELMGRLREVIELPVTDKEGKVIVRNINLLLKMLKVLDGQ